MKAGIRIVGVVLFCIILTLNLTAGGQEERESTTKAEYTVYVVVHGGIGDPYWKKVEKGIKDASALFGDMNVIYTGPDVFNFEQFMAMLESALSAQPDGLLATMTTPEAMDDLLRGAISDGLPVIAIDSPDGRPPLERIPYLGYVGAIPYDSGVLAGREMLKRFRPKRAVYGNHHPGALNVQEMGQGFIDVMKEAGIEAEAIDITEDPVKGAEIMANYLMAHSSTDAVYFSFMLPAETTVVRLEEENIKLGEDVKIGTSGLTSTTIKMLEEGKIEFSTDEQPYMQGFSGIVYMYMHLKYGFTPPPLVSTLGVFPEDIGLLKETVKEGIR